MPETLTLTTTDGVEVHRTPVIQDGKVVGEWLETTIRPMDGVLIVDTPSITWCFQIAEHDNGRWLAYNGGEPYFTFLGGAGMGSGG